MTLERAKAATPAQDRSLPKPFPEAPIINQQQSASKNKPEKAPDQARDTDPTLP